MKLSAIALLAFSLSGMAVAAPSSIPSDMSPLSQDLAIISLAQPDASCSLLKCAKVVGEAACIIEAIKKKSGKDLFKCAKKDNICGCAGCISSLGAFIDATGVCTAKGDPEESDPEEGDPDEDPDSDD